MSRLGLLARMASRYATIKLAPAQVGPRDRLTYYDRVPPWRPPQGLRAFLDELVVEQGLEAERPQLQAFLDYWLPRQALAELGEVLIEFSFSTDAAGFGVMIYGDNRSLTRAFRGWARRGGVDQATADRCAALCETFDPTDLSTVRAEFEPGQATRISLSSSWFLDPLRRRGGFARRLARLPEAWRDARLEARAEAIERAVAPDFHPLFLGLSFVGGLLEPKIYFLRYANDLPLSDRCRGGALVRSLGMPDAEFAEVRDAYRQLWRASEAMTQFMISVPADERVPIRMNLITLGTQTGVVRDLIARQIRERGWPPEAMRAVDAHERALQTGIAKYVAMRVTGKGLSPRIKIYGHARFGLSSAEARLPSSRT